MVDWIEKMKPFVCKGCCVTIYKPQNFSKVHGLCFGCYIIKEAVINNRCLNCGGPGADHIYWGSCKKCFLKPPSNKELEESNELDQLERSCGWESVEEVLEEKEDA